MMAPMEHLKNSYYESVYDTDRAAAFDLIQNARENGVAAEDLVFDVVLPTMEKMIVDLTENDNATLSQHFAASKVASEIVEMLLEHFETKPLGQGSIVIGTARGDFHGLGKRIVGGYLRAGMYTVHDLGMNVSAQKFVDEAERLNAPVIGISSMMMHTATGPEGPVAVRQELEKRGLSGKIKMVVGGAPYRFDEQLYKTVQADGWARDAFRAIALVGKLISGKPNHV